MIKHDIVTALQDVLSTLPANVKLVAVSKYHGIEAIEQAYNAGQRIFGESRERELQAKYKALPKDIHWHFIGHLQTNKVKYIVSFISMIETVDSFRLLKEIDKQATRVNRRIDVLLEIHVACESSKHGFAPQDCLNMLKEGLWRSLQHVRICGLMTMATNTTDVNQIQIEFTLVSDLFDTIKSKYFADDPSFSIRSWGMSQDYPLAVECRSTMVRIGTTIFGSNNPI